MQKLKQNKKSLVQLNSVLTAAIDKTVEAAISSRLENIDKHITQTITACLGQKVVHIADFATERKIYCPDAGP